jgi:putative molybdenum carrier protein
MIRKIVSGGQTGVDRAALDFAIRRGIPHGGYCPKGRRSERGRIPDKYRLTESESPDYAARTALNVVHSDGTLILTRGEPDGGTQRTHALCVQYGKPSFVIDLEHAIDVEAFAAWLDVHRIGTLNVAGPRESKQTGIDKQSGKALDRLFGASDAARCFSDNARDARVRKTNLYAAVNGRDNVLPPPVCVGSDFRAGLLTLLY